MSSDKIDFLRYNIYSGLVLESGKTIRYFIIGKDEIIMHLGIDYVCSKESGCLMSSDKIDFLIYDIYNKLVLESGETIRYSIIGKDEIIMHLGIEKVGLKKVYCTEEEKRRNDAALVNVIWALRKLD